MQLAIRVAALSGLLGATAVWRAAAQAPTLTVSGVGYAQYGYQLHPDSSLTPAGHQNNFDVTRAYLNVLGNLPAGLATRSRWISTAGGPRPAS